MEFPQAHIKVTNATSIGCVDLLESGQVDLIVVNLPNPYLRNIAHVKKIHTFKDVFVANESFEELKGKKLSLKELLEYPILMLNKTSTTSEFLHSLFQEQQLDLIPEIELSSNDLLIDLASIGLGIAFVPDYCIPHNSSNLFVVETQAEIPARELAIAYNNQIPISKSAQAFLNYFSDQND